MGEQYTSEIHFIVTKREYLRLKAEAQRIIAAGFAVLRKIVQGVDQVDEAPDVVEQLLQRPE